MSTKPLLVLLTRSPISCGVDVYKAVADFVDSSPTGCGVGVYKAVADFVDISPIGCGVGVYKAVADFVDISPIGCGVGVYKAVADFVDSSLSVVSVVDRSCPLARLSKRTRWLCQNSQRTVNIH